MASVQPDTDSRAGSATSLVRTVVGSSVRTHGGWMSAATFVALMKCLDVPAQRTRTALTRLKAKGLLVSESRHGAAGYAIAEDARAMLERGDRRIYNPRSMSTTDGWFLISFSVPEDDRHVRHQLKRRLARIGCGSVAGALWIGPGYLLDEAQQIVTDLELDGQVTLFSVHEIHGATAPEVAIAGWWDLPAISALHDAFLEAHATSARDYAAEPTPERAFQLWMATLDTWRPIPYLDPGLPFELLPAQWPGRRSVELFLSLKDLLSGPSERFIAEVAAALGGSRSDESP